MRSVSGIFLSAATLLATAAFVLLAPACHAQTAPPDKTLTSRPFESGLRVSGISCNPKTTIDEQVDADGIRTGVVLPDYMDPARLLSVAPLDARLTLRLQWTIESTATVPGPSHDFAVELAHHLGYARRNQEGDRTATGPITGNPGSVFWTDHVFPAVSQYPPGEYDVYVIKKAVPTETVALGQILLMPSITKSTIEQERVAELFPGAMSVFSGDAVLTRWFYGVFPVAQLPTAPGKIVIISSVDFLEDAADETPVATITVTYADGKHEEHPLLLGRDTASTWYRFHARGSVKHHQAPIARSWRVTQETVEFDASVYKAVFDLSSGQAQPKEVRVTYAGDKGILRLRAIAFLP